MMPENSAISLLLLLFLILMALSEEAHMTVSTSRTIASSYFPSITVMSTQTFPDKMCTLNQPMSESRHTILALGIVLGLCVMLLLVVTTGWVCTCRALQVKQKQTKNTLKDQRPAGESTDSDDSEVEKQFNNPFYVESTSACDYPAAKQDNVITKVPTHRENCQNDATLSCDVTSEQTVPVTCTLSTMDNIKEKYLKNPVYKGSLDFQADRFYERENYDCSQDDDDYQYDALDQGSSPQRDRSDDGSTVRQDKDEMSSIKFYDFPEARYDVVNRPCHEEGEDYDVLDHAMHVGSRVAASSFDCDEDLEKYFKNPIYNKSPCSSGAHGFQPARYVKMIPSLQEDGDSEDYDTLEPESNIAAVSRDEDWFLKISTVSHAHGGRGGANATASRPCDLPIARYDTVSLPCHEDAEDYDVLERQHEGNGQTPVRDDSYCRKNYSHLKL